ncbi:hypothetical protein GCM10027176_50140 [Actinoallomurus bryophytorum]|uniref:Histidine kinase-like protein n=1 Tax=Actinoallomurus bryophytorum TaxID=1490222 RepID=A0A543CEQ0_9ACTN|nr:ATP-binding protein [Actinoallomurus bryophytorum]TQL95574.1 hypothetical protein FB559_1082 [Actinoallomurus bryophytorum]
MSELVTNAVCYAPDLFTLECFISAGGRFVVEVADPSTELPIPEEAGPLDVHGRGLVIVDALADEWPMAGAARSSGRPSMFPRLGHDAPSVQVVGGCCELLKRVLDPLRLSP